MRGKTGLARIAGGVALGGAFYTATYITSYPGGAPAYAVLGLLAGTAGGIIALAAPRSATGLALAAVLLGFAFTGAVIHSGVGFLPGFVLMILAARRASRRDLFDHPGGACSPAGAAGRLPVGAAGSFAWMRLESQEKATPTAHRSAVRLPEADGVLTVPEADAVITLPEVAAEETAECVAQRARAGGAARRHRAARAGAAAAAGGRRAPLGPVSARSR